MKLADIRKLAGGTSVTIMAGLCGAALTYSTGLIVARFVAPDILGAYYLSLTWFHLAAVFSRFGLSDGALRFVPPETVRGDSLRAGIVSRSILLTSMLVAFLVTALAFGLLEVSRKIFGIDNTLLLYLRSFFFFAPGQALFIIILMIIQAHQKIIFVVIMRDLAQPLLLLGLTLFLLLMGIDERVSLVGGFGGSILLVLALAILKLVKIVPNLWARGKGKVLIIGPIIIFSAPNAISDAVHFAGRWVDTIVVGHLFGLHSLGVYSAAARTAVVVIILAVAGNSIYATLVSSFYHAGRKSDVERPLQLTIRWMSFAAIGASAVLITFRPELMQLWGESYTEATDVLIILALAHAIGVPTAILSYTLVLCNRQVREVVNTVGIVIVALVAGWVLARPLGPIGVALGLFVANLLGLIVRVRNTRLMLNYRSFSGPSGLPVVMALLLGVACVVSVQTLETVVPLENWFAHPEFASFAARALVVLLFVLLGTATIRLERDEIRLLRSLRNGSAGRWSSTDAG